MSVRQPEGMLKSRALGVEAFEHFMFADDRPSHPMTFWLRATLRGVIDQPRFIQAVAAAGVRHPLLTAVIEGRPKDRTKQLSWHFRPGQLPYLDFGTAEQGLRYPEGAGASIDLGREGGLRVFVRQGPRRATIFLQLHHAATDALGATRYFEDLLGFYGDAARSPETLPTVTPERLKSRGVFGLTAVTRRRRVFQDAMRALLFFRKFPQPISPVSAKPRVFRAELYPSAVEVCLSSSELAALRHGANRARATLNDLLLRDLFLTLDAWNQQHGGRKPLRLAMPMNMRHAADLGMPAANVVSMCFLDRAGEELDHEATLLEGITRETRFLKTFYMGYALIFVARVLGRVRGGLTGLMTPRLFWRCTSTAVLSNLGDPLAKSRLPRNLQGEIIAGQLGLESLELLPPIRPGTALAFGVVTYARALMITLHFDQTQLTASQAEGLLAALQERLDASMVAPEKDTTLLERLVQEHSLRRPGASAFWGLPIGKRVSPEAAMRELAEAPARTGAHTSPPKPSLNP